MKTTHIIVLVVVAIFIVALASNFASNASIYTDFAYAKKSGREVHIVGEWVNRDQAVYNMEQDLFTFFLKDTLHQTELVHFYDPKPNNFETAEKVVVVGGYKQDRFVADKIVMKCPSKYENDEIVIAQ